MWRNNFFLINSKKTCNLIRLKSKSTLMCEGRCIYLSTMSRGSSPRVSKSVYMCEGMKIFNESSIRRKEVFEILKFLCLI